MKEQLQTTAARAKTHLRATRDMYVWSSVIVSVASFASVVTGICLLHITRRGWDNSSPTVLGIFVVSLGSFVFYSSFNVLYQYDRNIKTNADLYTSYVNLEEEILTALATKQSFSDASPAGGAQGPGAADGQESGVVVEKRGLALAELIARNHKVLYEYHTLSLEFDLESIPSLDDIIEEQSLP
ncbi:MAG: hypothetical protein VKK04_09195 [Synechococcales bacterium]|nr:hypothetical protein [Synechococcales bacterium]